MPNAILLRSPGVSTAPGLTKLRRDKVLEGDNGGVKFLFDLSWAWSNLRAGSNPLDGDTIRDISEHGDGAVSIAAGQSVGYLGGGFDFSALTADPAVVMGPAGCLASIYAGSQYFLICGWARLPAMADWNTNAVLTPLFETSGLGGGFQVGPDLLTVGQASLPQFTTRRQTDGATADNRNLIPNADFYSKVVQWGVWRNATGQGLRLKSQTAEQVSTAAIGALNTGNFGGNRPRWGVPDAFNNVAGIPAHKLAAKARLYRGFVEDLQVSGRNPIAVLDADWGLCQSMAAFS